MFILRELGETGTGCLFQFTNCALHRFHFLYISCDCNSKEELSHAFYQKFIFMMFLILQNIGKVYINISSAHCIFVVKHMVPAEKSICGLSIFLILSFAEKNGSICMIWAPKECSYYYFVYSLYQQFCFL